MDNTGEYATVRFTQLDGEPSLQFGEFKIVRNEGTVYIGSGDFPIKEEGENDD